MPVEPPCYLRGTRIRTPEGEPRIEDLKIGDLVLTLSGARQPIKWIGRRRFKKSSKNWVKDFEPIRICRFALDEKTPHSDLYVSPGHAIYIDGSLIKAADLVNGLNITQCAPEGMHIIEYLHIELSTHDVIYAEGTTAETFWPFWCQSSHDQFDNFAEYYRLYGNQNEYPPCAPVLWGPPGRLERNLRKGLRPLRSVLEPWIDTRTSVEKSRAKIRDRIAERAKALVDS